MLPVAGPVLLCISTTTELDGAALVCFQQQMFERTNRTRDAEEIQSEAAETLRAFRNVFSRVSCTDTSSVSVAVVVATVCSHSVTMLFQTLCDCSHPVC